MDIEKLTKAQIVLLTLLVSFVTSMATGIVAVTLMDQAPPGVTQTIQRVVERTIETVTPNTQVITEKKEVVVTERNLIAGVVEKNLESFARIKKIDDETFTDLGIFVDRTGIILTSSEGILKDGSYYIVNNKGENNSLTLLDLNADKGIAYFRVVNPEGKIFKPIFKTVSIADSSRLKLGQSVAALSGKDSTEILTGIVSSFIEIELAIKDEVPGLGNSAEEIDKEIIPKNTIAGLKTNILASDIVAGTSLLDLEGNIIGINIDSNKSSFIVLDFVNQDLQTISSLSKEVVSLTE
ncbi:hypothetical protein A2442_04080 [Candidatus Campbellbacteria bacterium RIFOXYC2_FULL_35_25]|uniref:Serine protease n=1 Tax=Candidatus Campbellbacteria bacterium RIFOXYC2_FULL_35_25 TaxID=1797582 RepID=A0A1F5EK62_9BACT|nr:MAG: hypothetical protein A2442_04080 [Candidatus Campbellbacteria bacterium RIFOXYC2_FULL_35_25]